MDLTWVWGTWSSHTLCSRISMNSHPNTSRLKFLKAKWPSRALIAYSTGPRGPVKHIKILPFYKLYGHAIQKCGYYTCHLLKMILLTCHLNFHVVWLNFNHLLLSGNCISQALHKHCNTNKMCAVWDQQLWPSDLNGLIILPRQEMHSWNAYERKKKADFQYQTKLLSKHEQTQSLVQNGKKTPGLSSYR